MEVPLMLLAGLASLAAGTSARAADTSSAVESGSNSAPEEVVITGSLIPQTEHAPTQPLTVITLQDLQQKGFTNVSEALQRSSFATGAIQNPQETNTFTPGAQVVSFFGLSPSYTKILIDGRPMADYPALYNGTDIVPSLTGIPTMLLDSIDVLPGGQSSIYGSDAIAGVVNLHLKKSMDGPAADVRYGWTQDGGATQRRIALADGLKIGSLNLVVGGQYERVDPIWGYQRRLSDQYFANGSSPQTAERDWLVIGLYGQANGDLYYMLDPALCANVSDQFGGTVGLRTRGSRGQYCGTFRAGYFTIANGTEATQGYLHLSNDFNENVQVFADVMVDRDVTKFSTGTVSFQTSADSGPYSYYVDPNVQGGADLLNLQRIFSPEEAGNLSKQEDRDTVNTVRSTIGVRGAIGQTAWKYNADFTYTQNKLTEATFLAFTDQIENFFSPIFGPNLGPDPVSGQPQYAVNYAAFYKPITPAQYASFTGYANSHSHTEESLARAEITNSRLLSLPGGDAGLAIQIEGGGQGWAYEPDPRFLDGQTYLYTATAGSGHRSRYAGTLELRLPVISMVTLDASTRYDDYKLAGTSVHKETYNFGVEIRPLSSLLVRGKYGTAFKAPTLSDQFQGTSGFFTSSSTDYYTCAKQGYTAAAGNLSDCPYAGQSYFGTTAGNPHLQPITAKVAGAGLDWTPLPGLHASLDYLHWDITNEVQQQDSDQLLRLDSACLLGQLDVNSPSCVEAISQVTRDANGLITQINTPKVNVSQEKLGVLVLGLDYLWRTSLAGRFSLSGSFSDVLSHSEIRFAGDPTIDLLNSPFYSHEFKTKANLSLGWDYRAFGITLYGEFYGKTPNYIAQQDVTGYEQPGAGRLPTWAVANLNVRYEVLPDLTISGNVVNLTNRLPPIDRSTPGIQTQPFNLENFNNYGRSFFLEASYRVSGR
jgi:outer membrane receptor protein involved in Fe transport